MCGIVGVVAHTPVNQLLYDGLLLLQHRGQDAAGIVTSEGPIFHMYKGPGLVQNVFRTRNMRDLTGAAGIGHCRYPTAGSAFSELESQPFYVNSPFGVTLGHNGNLTNSEELKRELFQLDFRHVNTNSDSEVLLNVLALELERAAQHHRLDPDAIFKAVAGVHKRCRGAYAVVAMIAGYGMLAFRDPFGIRPLIIGKNEQMGGTEYIVASESVAIEPLGFHVLRDVAPGEAIFVDNDGQVPRAAVRRSAFAQSVHLRVRVSGASGFGHRRHVRVRGAAQHGRRAGGEDPAECPRRRISTSSSRFPTRAGRRRSSSRTGWASSTAKASSRIATSAARSSCRGRRCARRACARS